MKKVGSSIKRSIKIIDYFANNSGDYMENAEETRTNIVFKNTHLTSYPKIVPIQKNQYIASIFNNLGSTLIETNDLN